MRIDKTQVRQENERAKIADLRKDLDEQKNNLVKQQRSVDLEEKNILYQKGHLSNINFYLLCLQ